MLVAIENKSDISRCQTKFKGLIKKQLRQCENLKIGHLGGQISSKTYLNGKGVWWSYQSIAGSRHWNAFGLFVKKSGTQVIKAEINFPLSGIDRSVAGVFARGPVAGAVYILHNGRVGGGAAGVSKARFVEWYRGSSTTVFFLMGEKNLTFCWLDLMTKCCLVISCILW